MNIPDALSQNPIETPSDAIALTSRAGRVLAHSLLIMVGTGPATVALNAALGRLGPGVLGYYTLLTILGAALVALGFYGDSLLYVRYVPETQPRLLVPFVGSHTALVGMLGGIVCVCLVAFPQLLATLLHMENSRTFALYGICLAAVLFPLAIISSLLQATLDTGWQAIVQRIPPLLMLATSGALLVVSRAAVLKHYHMVLLVSLIVANACGVAVGVARIWRTTFSRVRLAWHWYLPSGFWGFTIPVHLSTLSSFLQLNLDQVLAAALFGTETLGKYKAVLTLSTAAGYLPLIIGTTAYPLASNMRVHAECRDAERRDLTALTQLFLISALAVAVICALFAREALGIVYGAPYRPLAAPLAYLSLAQSGAGISVMMSAILIAYGESGKVLAAGMASWVLQLLVTLSMAHEAGFYAIMAGRIVSLASFVIFLLFAARKRIFLSRATTLLALLIAIIFLSIRFYSAGLTERVVMTLVIEAVFGAYVWRLRREPAVNSLLSAMIPAFRRA